MDELKWNYLLPGLAIGLLGWLAYRAGSVAIGAIVGAGALGVLGYLAGGLAPPDVAWAPALCTGVGIVLGAVGGIMFMRAMMTYLFFVAGAIPGGAIVWKLASGGALAAIPGASQGAGLIVSVVLGTIAGGFLMVALRRFVVAVVTAFVGATLFSIGLPPHWQSAGWIISLVIFLIVQAGLVHRFVDRETFDRHSMHGRYRHEATVIRQKE